LLKYSLHAFLQEAVFWPKASICKFLSRMLNYLSGFRDSLVSPNTNGHILSTLFPLVRDTREILGEFACLSLQVFLVGISTKNDDPLSKKNHPIQDSRARQHFNKIVIMSQSSATNASSVHVAFIRTHQHNGFGSQIGGN